MAQVGEVKVKLRVDAGPLQRGLKDAGAALQDFGKKFELAGGLQAAGAAFGMATGAAAGFAAVLAKSASEAAEAEAAEMKLANALRATGQGAAFNEIKAYAGSLAALTTFTGDATVSAAAFLATTGQSTEGIKRLLPVAQDLATVMGVELADAAKVVGKAALGSTGLLERYGIKVSDAAKASLAKASADERAAIVADILAAKTEGMAQAYANTVPGALKQAKNAFDDIFEAFGLNITQSGAIRDALHLVTQSFANMAGIVSTSGPKLGQAMVAFGAMAIKALASIGKAFAGFLSGFSGWYRDLRAGINEIIATFVDALATVKSLGPAVVALGPAFAVVAAATPSVEELRGQASMLRAEFSDFSREAANMDEVLQPIAQALDDISTEGEKLGANLSAAAKSTQMFGAAASRAGSGGKKQGTSGTGALAQGAQGATESLDKMQTALASAEQMALEFDKQLALGSSADSVRELLDLQFQHAERLRSIDKLQQDMGDSGAELVTTLRQQADALHEVEMAALAKAKADAAAALQAEGGRAMTGLQQQTAMLGKDPYEQDILAAQFAADAELAEFQQMLEDKKLSAEQFADARMMIEQRLASEIQAVNERQVQEFANLGSQMAGSMVSGFQSFMQSRDPKDLFKGVLGALTALLPVLLPGVGAAIAPFVGIIASMMHRGGMVGSVGKPVLAHRGLTPGLSAGEFYIKARQGEGVLSQLGVAAMGGPDAVAMANNGITPNAGGGTTVVNNVMAFDVPSYSAVAPRTVEPVNARRLYDRQGGKYREALRANVRPARSS